MFFMKFIIISTSLTNFHDVWKSNAFGMADIIMTQSVSCDPPDYVINGALEISSIRNSQNKFPNGTFIRYSCKNGYKLEPSGSEIRYCNNGSWTSANRSCAFISEITCTKTEDVLPETQQFQTCPHPPKIPNTVRNLLRGTARANDVLPGTVFEIICDSGYRDTRKPCIASIITCYSGSWDGPLPNCVKVESCSEPPQILHGSIISPRFEMNYPISYEVMYACDQGYVTFPKNFPPLTLRCEDNGCWAPNDLPSCHPESSLFYGLRNGYDDYFHLTTGGLLMCILFAIFGVTSIMVAICSLSMCRQRYLYLRHRRRTARESRSVPNPVAASSIIRPNSYGRTAFIAFADGIQVEQHHLPTYDEVLRQDSVNGNVVNDCVSTSNHFDGNYGCAVGNCDIPVNSGNCNNEGNNNDSGSVTNQRNVRFSSQPSESIRYRSGLLQNHASNRDIMGSTDTVAISEVSANTLDNVSAHTLGSVSQNPSCRAMCGSLASFDACSVITEGYPLLEEYETENENLSNANLHVRSVSNNK